MSACEVCLELFDSDSHVPRILPCGHSLCEMCLSFLKIYDQNGDLNQNQALCPKCRAPISVPRLSSLAKNFSLIESSSKKKAIYCPQHEDLGLEAILFCQKCNVYVCAKCIATSHNAHEFEDLDKRVKRVKSLVQDISQVTASQKRKQEKIVESHNAKMNAILQSHAQERSTILAHFQKFIDQIVKEREMFLSTLDKFYKKDTDELEAMLELAKRRLQLVENIVEQIRAFQGKIEAMTDSELLNLEASSSELNDLKVVASNTNFQFVPEHQMHKYVFEGRDIDFESFDMGVISKELLDQYILVLGDSNDQTSPGFGTWMLTVASQMWEYVPMEVVLRSYSAACFVPDFQAIIITGGKERTCVRTTQILYPMMKKADTRSPMATARDGHVCVCYEGLIYVFGGFNEETGSLDSCESYDLVTDQWQAIRPMNMKRSMFACCLFGPEAFVFGGHHKGYLNTVEKFSFTGNSWLRLPLVLPCSAAGISTCVFRQKIHLLGGCQSNASFNKVYTFDPSSSELQLAGEMLEKRAFSKVFSVGNRLLVLGGGKNFTAEVWDGETWAQFESEGGPKSSLEKFTSVILV